MKVYKEKINFNLNKKDFFKLINYLNEKEKNKILKFVRYEYALRSLYGKILLMNALNLDKIDLNYNQYGKPELVDMPNTYFNISHCNKWVVLAIDNKPIGIDVEEIKEDHLDIAKEFFSAEENEYLSKIDKERRVEEFYKLWTMKEAFVKNIGKGLHQEFNSFSINLINNKEEVIFNNKKYSFLVSKLENKYYLSICTENDLSKADDFIL
ncbi:MAG: 4'-phosphopantetheinyl transferase superfamily protein [Clostridiales bacterium]|nr:4'-phosphopantetheinyl transferase superfamily protein [Clostridiales bacterium]